MGSIDLVKLLLKNDLTDELRLKIHPLIFGRGRSCLTGSAVPAAFNLTEKIVTPAGVIIAGYKRMGKV